MTRTSLCYLTLCSWAIFFSSLLQLQKNLTSCCCFDSPTQAILKILSVCCAPTDPPKSPRPKFFFRYFRFFIIFFWFPRTPIVRRKQTSKASSDFQNNQCTPRFKRHVVYSYQFQNDYQLSKHVYQMHFLIPVTLTVEQ